MAISIDWPTKVITIPKADTTLVDIGPPEIRSLDVNQFRKDLNALQASENGMPFETTHVHNPPVTSGGVTLSRVIEIINGYTITFEDGSYAVNVAGVNNNISDVANLNTVSIRSANSAGLQIVTQGSGVTAQDKTDIITGVWAEVLEGGAMTAARMLRSACAGIMAKLSGAKTAQITIRNITDTKDMATVDVDGEGNRTGVTYDWTE